MNYLILECKLAEPISTLKPSKYYQEIGAEIIGNHLMIRVEKDRYKLRKKSSQRDSPPCDCEMPEIKRATRTAGPQIVNVGDNIIFRLSSRLHLDTEDPNHQLEVISHQLGDTQRDFGRTMTVHPQLEGAGPQQVHQDHVVIGDQNIFMMRIKKDPDGKELKKRNIELEVTYPTIRPRIITPPPTPPILETQLSPPLSVSDRIVVDEEPVNSLPKKNVVKKAKKGKKGKKTKRKKK